MSEAEREREKIIAHLEEVARNLCEDMNYLAAHGLTPTNNLNHASAVTLINAAAIRRCDHHRELP